RREVERMPMARVGRRNQERLSRRPDHDRDSIARLVRPEHWAYGRLESAVDRNHHRLLVEGAVGSAVEEPDLDLAGHTVEPPGRQGDRNVPPPQVPPTLMWHGIEQGQLWHGVDNASEERGHPIFQPRYHGLWPRAHASAQPFQDRTPIRRGRYPLVELHPA